MAARLRMEGFAELREWMRTLPEHLTDEATEIVYGAADSAETAIAWKYKSESMRKALKTEKRRGKFGVTAVVKNTHPQALPYEFGTQVRQTRAGANRGSMPPANVFRPTAERERREMFDELGEMMRREGFDLG